MGWDLPSSAQEVQGGAPRKVLANQAGSSRQGPQMPSCMGPEVLGDCPRQLGSAGHSRDTQWWPGASWAMSDGVQRPPGLYLVVFPGASGATDPARVDHMPTSALIPRLSL